MDENEKGDKFVRVVPAIIKAASRVEMVTDKETIKKLDLQFEKEKKAARGIKNDD